VDREQQLLPRFASLAEVASAFSLTDDQARAFNLIGHGLLMSFLRDEEDCPEQPTAPTTTDGTSTEITVLLNQVLLFLHGMGGSGKSLAVHAMIALAISWDRPRAILTSAKSGVAAVNVEGYTVDSPSYKPKSFFDEVRMLISHT
jgi:hypothetical protein